MEQVKSKKKGIIIGIVASLLLIVTIGFTYAYWLYSNTTGNQAIVAGDIYMKYSETNEINATDMMPIDISNYYNEDGEFTRTPTLYSYHLNNNMTAEELSNCESYFNELNSHESWFTSEETPRAYCDGTGTSNGSTMKEDFAKESGSLRNKYLTNLIERNIVIETANTLKSLPYFEFTIEGKNTYNKSIWYEIVLNHGDEPKNRNTRIKDNLLSFRLVEVVGGIEHVLFSNSHYNDLINKKIYVNTIAGNTKEKITKTYRLYMWINNNTRIGVGENIDYDMDTWNNDVFASVKVTVNGDFEEKKMPPLVELIKDKLDDSNSVEDTDGTIYLSGSNKKIDFNYVWYSGKVWRVVAINPDGSVKLITQDTITNISYGETVDFKTSWLYQWLNEDFKDTLYNYENIVVQNTNWNATTDSVSEHYDPSNVVKPETLPNQRIVQCDIGVLNLYEYYQSYKDLINDYGYLDVGDFWYLLTPYNDDTNNIRYVSWAGSPNSQTDGIFSTLGVRPVINLKINIEIVSGDGSKNSPYKLTGDKELGYTGELINTRLSGEYVKVDNKVYRIVGIENGTTKLTSVDYVRDENSEVLKKKFGPDTNYATSVASENNDYWGYYLNNTWLTTELEKYITKGTYYLGQYPYNAKYPYNASYKNTICSESNTTDPTSSCAKTASTWTGLVGLPRVGEMLSAQFEGVDQKYMWSITPYSDIFIFTVDALGGLYSGKPESEEYAIRPSINLKSEIIITGGDGMTPATAYTIALPE